MRADERVRAYGEVWPFPLPSDPLNIEVSTMVGEVAAALGATAPVLDARLSAASAIVLPAVRGDRMPPAEATAFAAAQCGIIEPIEQVAWFQFPYAYVMQPDLSDLREHIRQILTSDSPARYGLAVGAKLGLHVTIVVLFADAAVVLNTVPRDVARDGSIALSGRLNPPYRNAEAYFTAPDGVVHPIRFAPSQGRTFDGTVRCVGEGRHQIELLAEGKYGPRVVANFPVWCGVPSPAAAEIEIKVQPSESIEDVEQRLLELINRDRARTGLEAVMLDMQLSAVARGHSVDMEQHGFVGHISPATGSVSDRLQAAGLSSEGVAENVARGDAAEHVHAGLMNSPGHRYAILWREAKQVGIGARLVEGTRRVPDLYVTEVFATGVATVGKPKPLH